MCLQVSRLKYNLLLRPALIFRAGCVNNESCMLSRVHSGFIPVEQIKDMGNEKTNGNPRSTHNARLFDPLELSCPAAVEGDPHTKEKAFSDTASQLKIRIEYPLLMIKRSQEEMNRVTIFGDIHSNLPALEAVFADIKVQEPTPLYCLGDLVGYGTFPNEVIAAVCDRNIPTLMGNYDQGVGNNSEDCGCAYTSKEAEALGKRSIA